MRPANQVRKPVQISGEGESPLVLCDDGSIWCIKVRSREWQALPPIPQARERNPLTQTVKGEGMPAVQGTEDRATPLRTPKAGDRIEIKLRKGNWILSEVKRFLAREVDMFECIGGWVLHVDDYGAKWRWPEDDPEVSNTEQPIIKGGDE